MPHRHENAIAGQLKSIIRDWNIATEDPSKVTVITNPAHVGHICRMRIGWRNILARYEKETGHAPDAELLASAPPGLTAE